jgi:uncharacterized protein YukJ
MPLNGYGVLKGRVLDAKEGRDDSSPHFQVKVSGNVLFRIAVNVKSGEEPSSLLYIVDDDFDHPILKNLLGLSVGFHPQKSRPGGLALDFVRGNLFDISKMKVLPCDIPGPDNDLNDLIQKYIRRSRDMPSSTVYAFGQRWGPEKDESDEYFAFKPGNGIHDIHMNQGNSEKWAKDDGTWQDGGLLIHFPDLNQWVAIFLAFQSQGFNTDDKSGHRIQKPDEVPLFSRRVAIVAALANPVGSDQGLENVTLLNVTPQPIDISGWKLVDKNGNKMSLSGVIPAGQTARIRLAGTSIELPNDGGIITLTDKNGQKVHGVSYTARDSLAEGWTIVF